MGDTTKPRVIRYVMTKNARCWKCLAFNNSVMLANQVEDILRNSRSEIDSLAKKINAWEERECVEEVTKWAVKRMNKKDDEGVSKWPPILNMQGKTAEEECESGA